MALRIYSGLEIFAGVANASYDRIDEIAQKRKKLVDDVAAGKKTLTELAKDDLYYRAQEALAIKAHTSATNSMANLFAMSKASDGIQRAAISNG